MSIRIVPLVEGTPLYERRNAIRDEIARRAYELYLERDEANDYDLEAWITAQMELLQPVPVRVTEQRESFVVLAEAPGFRPREIEVGVDSYGLVIRGKKENEREDKSIFQELDLPAEIDQGDGEAQERRPEDHFMQGGSEQGSSHRGKGRMIKIRRRYENSPRLYRGPGSGFGPDPGGERTSCGRKEVER